MILKKWNDIPECMRNNDVKIYYDILNKKRISLMFKRIFDIIASCVLLILLSPMLIVVAIWIKFDSKGPVFYRQKRVTQYGEVFSIYKFRTMVVDADKLGSLVTLKDDQRITRVGNRIRKYRIDEVPQLINILIGNMTFVGTRPEVPKYIAAYSNEMKATLLLKAGVTSSASIKFKDEDEILMQYQKLGRSTDDIYITNILPEKMAVNLTYLKEYSFCRDLKICIETVLKV